MRPLYHLTILPPSLPRAEAVSQEVAALQARFGGELVYLNPNRRLPVCLPRLLFGWQALPRLRALEKTHSLHHLFNPDPFPFPVLRALRLPIVYTLTGGVVRKPDVTFFSGLAAIVVADERSLQKLRAWGLQNVTLIRPGIDMARFTPAPPPPLKPFRLLVGSAPWTKSQFRAKGVEALLHAAQQNAGLHLVFLWRGVLYNEIKQRVQQLGLERQVTVINKFVDVNALLTTVHAAVALATDARIIKPYPHSLLEAMAAARPVLVSRAISMADYVEATGCGVVVKQVSADGILAAVEALSARYAGFRSAAQRVGPRDFSQQTMLAAWRRLYRHL